MLCKNNYCQWYDTLSIGLKQGGYIDFETWKLVVKGKGTGGSEVGDQRSSK